MNAVSGIQTQVNEQGKITRVTIDVEQHENVMIPVLQQLGVLEKSEFMKEFEQSIPLNEAYQHTMEFARSLWKK